MPRSPLATRLDGLLFFPVTPFDGADRVALEVFRQHVAAGIDGGAAAVFACCGTGEFNALDLEEYATCVRAAVEVAAGRVPVMAGVGYGTALAKRFLAAASDAGADGALVLPPYLIHGGPPGLRRHYEALADATELGLILYQRDTAVLDPETVAALARHTNIVGIKDGLGDLDLMQRIISIERASRAADGRHPLLYLNGMPTAELTQPAYQAIGVNIYSSAVFCFAPQIALAYYRALRAGDTATVRRLLDGFYSPFVALRSAGRGYAVALIKAGVRLSGLDVGPVRSPLCEPADKHVMRLAELIERGSALLA